MKGMVPILGSQNNLQKKTVFDNSYKTSSHVNFYITIKESLNRDGQQFHKYHQSIQATTQFKPLIVIVGV